MSKEHGIRAQSKRQRFTHLITTSGAHPEY
jgi:hypothetical protein